MNAEDKNTETCDLKTREQWLRDEVMHHRALLFSLIQWGMALLLAVESALYFARRDIAQGLAGKQFVVPAQELTFGRWFFGTLLLIVIAALFSVLMLNLIKRYVSYREKLNEVASLYSKIDDSPVRKLQWIPLLFFWAIPIIDFAVWLVFHK
jgi:ABC-type phosphate transport system permease subunit